MALFQVELLFFFPFLAGIDYNLSNGAETRLILLKNNKKPKNHGGGRRGKEGERGRRLRFAPKVEIFQRRFFRQGLL